MIKSQKDLLTFINAIRESDYYIKAIYTEGGCYRFHLLLKKLNNKDAFTHGNNMVCCINAEKDHVVTKFKGKFYDITGEVSGDGYTYLTRKDKLLIEKWSFSKNKCLQLTECPACEEPIVV